MSDQPNIPRAELDELINQFLDDTLSDEGMQKLDRALDESASARSQFLQFLQMHVELGEDATVDEHAGRVFGEFCRRRDRIANAAMLAGGEPTTTEVSPRRRRDFKQNAAAAIGAAWAGAVRRPALVFAAGALTAVVCGAAWFVNSDGARPGRHELAHNSGAAVDQNPIASIGKLTYLNGCSWGGTSPQFTKLDSLIRTGEEVTLYEGLAEFRLSSGVSLSIEGPASLVLTSPVSLVLQHGRVTVYVPPSVDDFRLVTPACRLTCRQTEFGVQVIGGSVDVHAFSGQVLAEPALGSEQVEDREGLYAREEDLLAGEGFSKATIEAGRGLALTIRSDDTFVSRWHASDETQFATRLSMANKLPITKPYVKAVLDSQPIGYWRFEKPTDGVIANEVGGLAGLAIAGNVDFVGDAKNGSLELGRPGSIGALYCKNELNLPRGSDYSVEIWMKPSHFHRGGLVGMTIPKSSANRELGAFCLLTTRASGNQQCLRFMHRDPPGFDPKTGTDCYSTVSYRLRRWQHVAAVKLGPEMQIYLDGKLVGKKRDESSLASHLCVIVGELSTSSRVYPFVGQLDELAIYPHALSKEEIDRHIKSVKWESGQNDYLRNEGI